MKRWLLALVPALWLAGCGDTSSSTGLGWLHAAWHAEQTVAWRGELHLAAAGTSATVEVEADGHGRQSRLDRMKRLLPTAAVRVIAPFRDIERYAIIPGVISRSGVPGRGWENG